MIFILMYILFESYWWENVQIQELYCFYIKYAGNCFIPLVQWQQE